MSEAQPIAVVTGANRGIGLETCRQLGELGYRVVLTSRDEGKGERAALGLRAARLDAMYHPLDVTDRESIGALAGFLGREFGRLDVLVNNAGVFLDSQAQGAGILEVKPELLRASLETNTYGPIFTAMALVPLMRRNGGGRIVNVSSGLGQLAEMGGMYPGYRISKTALNAVTRILAAELAEAGVLVNSACPGWVRTDMGGANAERSVEQGADTIVWLASAPEVTDSGGFYRDRKPIPW